MLDHLLCEHLIVTDNADNINGTIGVGQMAEWKQIWSRDWPGIIATVITFALFGVGVFIIVDSRYAMLYDLKQHQSQLDVYRQSIQLIIGENERTRLDLLYIHKVVSDHSDSIKHLEEKLSAK